MVNMHGANGEPLATEASEKLGTLVSPAALRICDLTPVEAEALVEAVPGVKDMLRAIEISRRRTAGRLIIQRETGTTAWKAAKYAKVIRFVMRRKGVSGSVCGDQNGSAESEQ